MSIQAVIWDLGGVLVRTEDWEPRESLAAELGMSRQELEHLMFASPEASEGMLGKINGEEHFQSLGRQFSMDSTSLTDRFFAGDRLDEELIAHIRDLQPEFRTALLSNAFSTLRHFVEHEWKIADVFDYIFISAELGLAKPDPKIYQHVLKEIDIPAGETVFVDDFAENVEAARQLGMHAIRFETRHQTLTELKELLSK